MAWPFGQIIEALDIGGGEAEVIEAQVLSTSPMAGNRIADIDFPEGVLVGGVLKGDRYVKPAGSTRIDEDDVVVIFAMAGDVPEVERLVHHELKPRSLRAKPAPGWLKVQHHTRNLAGGMFEEDCEVWDSTGRLVAQSRQLALAPRTS